MAATHPARFSSSPEFHSIADLQVCVKLLHRLCRDSWDTSDCYGYSYCCYWPTTAGTLQTATVGTVAGSLQTSTAGTAGTLQTTSSTRTAATAGTLQTATVEAAPEAGADAENCARRLCTVPSKHKKHSYG